MKRLAYLLLGALAAAALLACGDDDGPGVSFDDWALEHETQVDTICDCYDGLGWDSRSQCVSGQPRIGPSQQQCARDAIAADPEASSIFASCLLPLQRNFTECVDEQLDCGDDDSLQPCTDDFSVGLRDCDSFSASTTRELDSCGVELEMLEVARVLCDDTCATANDNECDDGGPDALYASCELGTDCADCGPR